MRDIKTAKPRSSICLIVCYFGNLPRYLNCVLRSCECNGDIEWLIFTDDKTEWRYPSNIHIKHTTLADLREEFSNKLGFGVVLQHPHKLCDFKPAYGFLFPEYLKGFDFWGHCDLDVIFGDIRQFLAEDILGEYDKILVRGHLCLYRNTPKVNSYFMLQPPPQLADYRKVFSDTAVVPFDEWRGIYSILRYHSIPQYQEEILVDVVPPTRWRYTRYEGTQIPNYPRQVFYWHKGKVFQAYLNNDRGSDNDRVGTVDREFAYIHFQKRPLPTPHFDPFSVDGFLITPEGFVPYAREYLSEDDYRRLNRSRFRPAKEILQRASKSFLRRLGL